MDVTVQVFHNISRDAAMGLNTLLAPDPRAPGGYRKHQALGSRRHPLVLVFEYQVPPRQDRRQPPDAEDHVLLNAAWHAFNVGEHGIAGPYRARRLRSLSKGDVISVGGRYWSAESGGWLRRTMRELMILENFDPVAFFMLADGEAPSHTVPWDPQATGFCHWCKTIRPIMEVEPFNRAANVACMDVMACRNRVWLTDGGGLCGHCEKPVYVAENGQVRTADDADDDHCPADPGHFHSQPVTQADRDGFAALRVQP